MSIEKWEARVIGAVAIGALTVLLMLVSPTPPEVVLFGLIAGAFAGGKVWDETNQR